MGRRQLVSMAAITMVWARAWVGAAWAADAGTREPPMLEVHKMRSLDAVMVAENLNQLLQQRQDIKVVADPKQNQLLLLAVKTNHETLRAFLALVDRPVEPGRADAKPIPPGRVRVPNDRASQGLSEEAIAKMSHSELRKFVSDLQKRVARLERNTSPRIMPLVVDSKSEK